MSKIKVSAILSVIAFVFLCASVFFAVSLHHSRKELRRVKSNYGAVVSGDQAAQQVVDVRELKEYFDAEVSALKDVGVQARRVENIVEVSYYFRDTVVYRDTLIYIYDTVRDTRSSDFCIQADCYDIDGRVVDDTLEIYGMTAHDDIMVALYREKRSCLFQRQKVKAVAISSCTGDTLKVIRNIKVER